MKIVAFVPIRLNSKRVVGKNLKLLGDKPLMCYVLETLSSVSEINEIFVYCSDEAVVPYLPKNVKFLKRPKYLDQDETLGEEIYDAFTAAVDADIYILCHTTSPFIKAETIRTALSSITRGDYNSAFSAQKFQTFSWFKGSPLNYQLNKIPRTQTLEPIYVETSAFYMFRREIWTKMHQRIGNNPYVAVVDKIEGIDIDWPEDFAFAEEIMRSYKQ